MSGSNSQQTDATVQFSLGKLEAMGTQNVKDISELRTEFRGLVPQIAAMIKSEIGEGLAPIDKRLGSVEEKVNDVAGTVAKWKAVLAVIASLGALGGYLIGNFSSLKKIVGG